MPRKQTAQAKAFDKLPYHAKRQTERKAARKGKEAPISHKATKRREWSANRPVKPATDPLHIEMSHLVGQMAGSAWMVADRTGLSVSTVYRLRNMAGKSSMGITLQMVARAAGGRLVFVKDN